ncbi:MAG: DUF523 domain-containing protein [Colwellia sp.]
MNMKILISSCFLGSNVRYNGKTKKLHHQYISRWLAQGRLVSICPEVSGGLPVPRPPAELQKNGIIMTQKGENVTDAFALGAQHALEICIKNDIAFALLKESSPSCGSHNIYDGSFSKTKILGEGVTASLLKKHHIQVFSENEIEKLAMIIEAQDK